MNKLVTQKTQTYEVVCCVVAFVLVYVMKMNASMFSLAQTTCLALPFISCPCFYPTKSELFADISEALTIIADSIRFWFKLLRSSVMGGSILKIFQSMFSAVDLRQWISIFTTYWAETKIPHQFTSSFHSISDMFCAGCTVLQSKFGWLATTPNTVSSRSSQGEVDGVLVDTQTSRGFPTVFSLFIYRDDAVIINLCAYGHAASIPHVQVGG